MRPNKASFWQFLAFYLSTFCKCSSTNNSTILENGSLAFHIKLASIGYENVSFKIVDDDSTPFNYIINYKLENVYEYIDKNGMLITEKKHIENTLEILTNTVEANYPLFWSSGDQLSEEELKVLKVKTPLQQHLVTIDALEQDRVYEISFDILCSLAQSKIFRDDRYIDLKRSFKKFKIKFRTHFDVEKEAEASCMAVKYAERNGLENILKNSCYQISSNCTKCKPDCYMVKSSIPRIGTPVLCRKCPCDKKKSSGVCEVSYSLETSEDIDNLEQPIFRCTHCIWPYKGSTCDECEFEGFEFYKNKNGWCENCECNGNSKYENSEFNSNLHDNKMRKCAVVTGECIDCLFNTSGRTCNECKKGFHGDPLKRTCKSLQPHVSDDEQLSTTTDMSRHQYIYDRLLFLYLLTFVLLVLVVYISVFKYSNSNKSDILKPFTKCVTSIAYVTREIYYMLLSFCLIICSLKFKPQNLQTTRINNVLERNEINDQINYDDRLNLTEFQVFDEDALFETEIDISNKSGSHKNPYQELTVKF